MSSREARGGSEKSTMALSLVTFTLQDKNLNIERGPLVAKRVEDLPYTKVFFELQYTSSSYRLGCMLARWPIELGRNT